MAISLTISFRLLGSFYFYSRMFCEYLILFHPHHFRLHVYTAILQRLKNRGKGKATMPTNDSRRDLGSPHIKGMNSFTFRQLLQVIIVIAVNNIFNSWQMKCEKFRCRSSSLSACSTEPITSSTTNAMVTS